MVGVNINNKKPAHVVQSLDRALDIVGKLVETDRGFGVMVLSVTIDLHKSTVYRLLSTLHYQGYVKKDKPSTRITNKRIKELTSIVKKYSYRISESMDYKK